MITRVLVGSIIVNKGRILLLKRNKNKKFLPGYYDLPGGKVEPGEDPNKAIVREVNEETGLDTQIIQPYNVWSDIIEFDNTKEHIIEIDFIMKIVGGIRIVLSPREHSEFVWVGKAEIPDKISPQLKATINRFFEKFSHFRTESI